MMHRVADGDADQRRMTRAIGAAGSLGLAVSAALHVVWLVSPWPLADWAAWSHAFGGPGFHVPALIMVAVAGLFAAAAYLLGARAGLVRQIGPGWLYRVGTWGLATVLLSRAVIGFVDMSRTLADPRTPELFRTTIRLYLSIYLPVFFVLGLCAAYVAATARVALRRLRG